METLVKWIEELAAGEVIEGVVIGEMGWGDYKSSNVPDYESMPKNKLLSWEEGKRWLNYSFDSGYGAPKCNAITAWTATKVIAISQYDGSTSPFALPRHPSDHQPIMPGG